MRLNPSLPAFLFLSAAFTAGPISAQESDDTAPVAVRPEAETPHSSAGGETAQVFVEIELTTEGAIAFDSAGGRWSYDFERLQFVPAPDGPRTDRPRTEGGPEEQAAPVEVRCTELKVVDNPALSAVYVNPDEYVDGDIVAYSRVTVKGWVKGNVRSLNKAVLVTSTGQVDGRVEAPEVDIRPGGRVLGEVITTKVYEIPVGVIASSFSRGGLWVVFGFTLALVLIAFLSHTLAPSRLTAMSDCASRFQLRTVMVGILFVFLLAPIIALVTITIVGILVVWLVPVAYFVAFAVGIFVVGNRMLRFAVRYFAHADVDPRFGSAVGISVYMGLWALTALAWGSDNPAYKSGGLDVWLLVISILMTCYPLLVGIGAAVLTRFGAKVYVSRQGAGRGPHEPAPAPAPPPMPEAPGRFEPRFPPHFPGSGSLRPQDPDPHDTSRN